MSTTTLWKALAMVFTVALSLIFLSPALATTEHCPDHQGHAGKVEGQNNDLILPAGTSFCVKASNDATGTLVADGVTSLIEYVEQADIVNGNGHPHDVSYYIVYEVPNDEPTEDPTDDPTGEPTNDPTEDPTEEPTETETPEPTEEPTVTPEPTPSESSPEPAESPEPSEEPTSEPSDEPTNEPTDDASETVNETPDKSVTLDELPRTGVPAEIYVPAIAGAFFLAFGVATLLLTRKR